MKFQQHNVDSEIESSQNDYEEVNDDNASFSQQYIPSEIELSSRHSSPAIAGQRPSKASKNHPKEENNYDEDFEEVN